MPFLIIDVSGWPPAREEQLGTKPKQWLARPSDGGLWLWKESTWNVGKGGDPYRKGDDWSERIACEVGRALGIPVAEVELASHHGRLGVVSRRFVNSSEGLVHGNELLAQQNDPCSAPTYTVGTVMSVLSDVAPPDDHHALPTAIDWFAGYLVLDALVGNTDRHIENWGVIRRTGDPDRLAPSFDHASSLGFLLDDDQRAELLEGRDINRTVQAFASRTRTKFDDRPHTADAALDLLAQLDPETRQHWITRVTSLESIDDVLHRVPASSMSETARAFASSLYQENHAKLSQGFRSLST
ncbi:MAG TPA: HipA domain-containing protein [Acidimicrobiales bacterium]|nr:HipA domain-containing protein [Acidimicrobiales bacterium]